MSLAWKKEKIWVLNKMRTYDLPYTRRALSIHFELLRTHEERGHILYIYISFFFCLAQMAEMDKKLEKIFSPFSSQEKKFDKLDARVNKLKANQS